MEATETKATLQRSEYNSWCRAVVETQLAWARVPSSGLGDHTLTREELKAYESGMNEAFGQVLRMLVNRDYIPLRRAKDCKQPKPEVFNRAVTNIRVYWNCVEPNDEHWAYRANTGTGQVDIGTGASIGEAAVQAAYGLGLELDGDHFAYDEDGLCASWERL